MVKTKSKKDSDTIDPKEWNEIINMVKNAPKVEEPKGEDPEPII